MIMNINYYYQSLKIRDNHNNNDFNNSNYLPFVLPYLHPSWDRGIRTYRSHP